MPIPEDRLYEPRRINVWFAVSSVVMTASIFWMIAVDYARPWHGFQDAYFVGKAAIAHLDYLSAIREDRTHEVEKARNGLASAKQYVKQTQGDTLRALRAELAEADLGFKKSDGTWSKVHQVLEVTRDTYEKALRKHGPDHVVTKVAHKKLRQESDAEEVLRKEKEHWEDTKKKLEKQIAGIEAPILAAKKRLETLEDVSEKALERDQQYRGVLGGESLLAGLPVVKGIVNLPLFDFSAPKNTPSRYQVNQLVLPDIRQQLNYLVTYTTDRCTTCHVGIADPEFSKDWLARKLERSLPGVNEALQRMGYPPYAFPTPPKVEGPGQKPLPVGSVTNHWAELTREQQDAYFDALLGLVNRYFKLSGRKTIELGQPLLAHPDLDLYLSADSPHPMAKMGCTVCHDGNPQETDFVLAGHTPPTHEAHARWEEQYYVRNLGVPRSTFEWMEHYWNRPIKLPRYTEASCAKCHTEVTDIGRFDRQRRGQRISLGRHLFTNLGCVNCHQVDDLPHPRRVGPDLSHIAAKLTPAFVQQWAFFPQKFRPSTRMPHLFQQENNLPASANSFDPDPQTRTETEVAAISLYLFSVSKEWHPIEKPAGVAGDVERGRQLFRTVGCLACHANLAEFGEEQITNDLAYRLGMDKKTASYRYKGMTYKERVRYAMDHFVPETVSFLNPKKVVFDPDKPYNVPIFSRVGPELSGIGSKVAPQWLYSWLINPSHYFPGTKMPSLRLSAQEAADLSAYLMTLKQEGFEQHTFAMNLKRRRMVDDLLLMLLSGQRSERRSLAIMKDRGGELTNMLVTLIKSSMDKQKAYDMVSSMTLEQKKLTYLGNKMIAHYGCYACHLVPGFESATPPGTNLTTWGQKPISQLDFAFYGNAFRGMRADHPDVYGHVYPLHAASLNEWSPGENKKEQISHTHEAFARHKLLNPRIWDRGKIKRPYDKLKMPNFYLTERQAEALTTYLLSRVSPLVADKLKISYGGTALGPIAKGRNLTRELNCVGCHQIEDNVPTIQQYYRRKVEGRLTFDGVNAPPLLWGEGAKLQHQWFHRFLQQVEPLRPWLQIRMPSFYLTGEQATTLVKYFAALSQHDSQQFKKWMGPVEEYQQREKAKKSAVTDDETQPGGNWYKQENLERIVANLRDWSVRRKLMRSGELDPLRSPPGRVQKAHATMLKRIRFMTDLYDVEYPFVEPPQPVSPPKRFEKGRNFFHDMGCLQCHVLGNMLPGPAKNTEQFVQTYRLDSVRGAGDKAVAILNGQPYPVGSHIDGHTLVSATNVNESGDVETKAVIEGPNAEGKTERVVLQPASAPNLSLAYRRLRREWVVDWMLEPGLIQPGTNMPQNFPDGQSPFAGDPKYPGSGMDHINLLVDFLYDAGFKGIREPLAKIAASAEGGEFEEEDFDEEE